MELQNLFSFDISAYAMPVRFAPGEYLFAEGERTHRLIILFHGRVKCYTVQENGTITLLDLAEAPCLMGEMELLGLSLTTTPVSAITACEGWCIDTSACGEQLLQDPVFLLRLSEYSNRKLLRISRASARNSAYRLRNRFATFILDTQQDGLYAEPHTVTAPYLGVTYRHLLYVLAQFVDEGLMEKIPEGYSIRDRAGLEALRITD